VTEYAYSYWVVIPHVALLIIFSLIPSIVPLNHEGPFSPHSSGMSLVDQAKLNQQNTLYFSATRLQMRAVMSH